MDMFAVRTRLGRLVPFFLFLCVLTVGGLGLAGLGRGEARASVSVAAFTVDAHDIGAFGGDPPSIKSPSAVVINMTTGKILYERKARTVRRMASTTKIMTGILVLEKMDLATKVTVSAKAAQTIEPKTWLREGDVLTVEQLLYALLLRSANSAAVALAEACSGSVEAFAAEMNAKAAEIGMEATHFVNPNGLDANGHQSTAVDMATLGRYAMDNAMFRKIVATPKYTVSLPGRSEPTVFVSTNKLMGQVDWVNGIKTGLTPKAEQCLVASGTRDGVSIISVILGQPSTQVCWDESKALLEFGLSQYRRVSLLEKGLKVAEADVPYAIGDKIELVTAKAVEMELYKDDKVTAAISLDRSLELPVREGESFGRVTLTLDGKTVDTVDLVATDSAAEPTLRSKLAYLWHKVTGGDH